MRRFTCAAVVAASFAAAATAQSKAVLGRDNAEFARALLDTGYDDLAEGLSRAIVDASGGGNFEEELAIKMIALEIRQVRAARESDVLKRKDLIVSVINDKNAFIADNTRQAEPVRASMPGAYFVFGDALAKALKAEADPARAAALRQEGQTQFAAAEQSLHERVERFHEDMGTAADPIYATRQYASALYNLSVIYYFHALIYPDGDPEQKRVLKLALDGFLEFGLDFQDDLLNYRGMVFQGLCNRALGDDKQAARDFDDAIALRKTYGEAVKGVFDNVPADAVDVISWAFQEKVRLFAEQGKHDQALAAARDYFATMPEPVLAERGLAVLLARAREEKASGDVDAARASADELVAADPNGQYGYFGRQLVGELLGVGGGASVGPAGVLRVAETLMSGGELERALDLCRQAREQALGTPEAAEVGAQSFMLEGSIFGRLGRLHEASIAFDLVAELYPASARAGDGLWNAVQAYSDLHNYERGPFYSKRSKERMAALANRYPNHPKAAYAQLVEAKQLEGAGEWQKAVDLCLQMKPGSAGYEQGQFRAGNALYRLAQKLTADKKDSEAADAYKRAELQLKSAITQLDRAAADTLDRALQAEFKGYGFQARGVLATLLLDRDRPAEVEPLLTEAETRFGDDPSKLAKIWSLRIETRIKSGKLDEAVGLLDSLIQKDPNGEGVSGAAGRVARALDQAGVDEFEKDPHSAKIGPLWRKAAHYYSINIRPQLDGRDVLNPESVSDIAQRLVTMGLNFNEVPVSADSFVDWQGKAKEPAVWDQAVEIYRKLLAQAPSTRTTIQLGRVLGLLGKYSDASDAYAPIFDRQKLFTSAGKLDSNVLSANPELLDAYLEWGVTEHWVGKADKDKARLTRAGGIFRRMVDNTVSGEQRWWRAKYFQVLSLYETGDYDTASNAIKDVKRTQSENYDEGKFGFKERFVALEQDIKKKVR